MVDFVTLSWMVLDKIYCYALFSLRLGLKLGCDNTQDPIK